MVLTDSDRISQVPPYSGYWYLKTHFIYGAITLIAKLSNLFYYTFLQMFQSYNPDSAETKSVWAISTSLAATTEITIVFFSCAYLDVSVQRVCFLERMTCLQHAGFPHSEIYESKGICPSS